MPRLAVTLLAWLAAVTVGLTEPAQIAPRSLVGTTIRATVTHIVDGDTLEVTNRNYKVLRIRLDGVDAPEFGRPFSRAATNFTRTMTFQQDADIQGKDIDRYGRLVARVRIAGQDVSVALVDAGLAWHYVCYSNDARLADAERQAKAAKRGLWSVPATRPPWNCVARPGAAAAPSGPFRGNASSKLYHALTCVNADCKNCTVTFRTESDARATGYRPAGDCLAGN